MCSPISNTLQVNLPQASNAKQEIRSKVVMITIMANGDILYDKDIVPNQDLVQKVHNSLESDAETVFVLRGDKSTRYENIVAVLDLLKKSGTRHVSIATEMRS